MAIPALKPYRAPTQPIAPTNWFWQRQLKSQDQSSRSYYEFFTQLNLLPNAVNDAGAAAAGVRIGSLYRNANAIQVRLV